MTTVVEEHEVVDFRLEYEKLGKVVVSNNVEARIDVYYQLNIL